MIRPSKLHADKKTMFIVYKLRISRIKATIIIILFYLFKDFTIYKVPLPVQCLCIFITIHSQPYYYCSHFAAEKTEAQTVYDCSRSKHCKLQDQDVTFWNAFPQHQLLALEVSEGSSIQV